MFDFKTVTKAVLYVHVLLCSYFIIFSNSTYLSVYAAISAALGIAIVVYKGTPKKYSKYCAPLLLMGLVTLFGFTSNKITFVPLLFLAITCISSLYADLVMTIIIIGYSVFLTILSMITYSEFEYGLSRSDFFLAFFAMFIGQIMIVILIIFSKNTVKNSNNKTNQVQELLKEVEEKRTEAENADKAKSDFLANMSHEIRTPMNAICGMVELLLQSGAVKGQNLEYLNTIKVASDGLLSLINDILDFSKIEAGKIELLNMEYNLSSTVNDIVNIINTKVDTQKVAFYVNMNPRIPAKLVGDENRVKQIITNLLSNAVKFTKEGFISLNIDYQIINESSIRIEIAVNDSGIGIKKEHLEKIFEEFQQVDTRRNRNIQGTGLGLPISKRFAEMMGGSISIESQYGVGSTFSVVILQKIKDFTPSATVNSPEQLFVLVYDPNNYYLTSMNKLFKYLEIKHDVTDDIDEFNVLISCRKYTHCFFDFESGINVINNYHKENHDCITVGMVSTSGYNYDITDRQEIMMLRKPIYFTSVVPILNGTKQSLLGSHNANELSFVAPDAKVLLVDDNIVNLKVAEGLFKTYMVKVDTATGGFEAIDKIKDNMDYDIIFMDHMMPQIDGVDTTKIIRNTPNEYCRKVPIIAFTANAVKDAQLMFLESGFDDFLSKPIEVKALKQVMLQWIPKSKQIKAQPLTQVTDAIISSKGSPTPDLNLQNIDTNMGLASCMGDKNAYMDILKIFAFSSTKNIENIENSWKENNLIDFTTYVHSVKSSAKSIGASSLSDLAMKLENAGKKEDKDYINLYLVDFITLYKETTNTITENLNEPEDKVNPFEIGKKRMTRKVLLRNLNQIIDKLDDFDQDGAIEIFDKLKEIKFNKKRAVSIYNAYLKLSEYEYDDAMQIVKEITDELIKEVGE